MATYLARRSAGARVPVTMGVALHATINPVRNVCQRKVLRTNPKDNKTGCVLTDGTSILVSNFLASFIRAGDDLLFSVELETADSSTEIYIRDTNPGAKRRDVLQTRIGYASQPRKDKRNNLFVSAEVLNLRLGISAIYLPNEALRDYFYVGNRHRVWDRQPSLYELLRSTAAHPRQSSASLSNSALLNSARRKHPTATLRNWNVPSISLRAQNCELATTRS